MRILILTKKFPYPPKDGETIVLYNYLKALHLQGVRPHVFCLNTKKQRFDPNAIPDDMQGWATYHFVDIDTDIKPLPALANLAGGKSYHVDRFDQEHAHQQLGELLKKETFDIVQFETIYTAPYLDTVRKYSDAKCVLRSHNVEHIIWEHIAANESNPAKKAYLKIQSKRLKDYELKQTRAFDALVPITDVDADKFRGLGIALPMLAMPLGLEMTEARITIEATNAVGFIGSLDWLPNEEGVLWFVKEVWPLVNKQLPEANFQIAGRNMPTSIAQIKQANVEVVGEVESAKDFVNNQQIMVVPLLSGSGMRIKIVEAMALGKAVVTTSLGIEGIAAENGREAVIEDHPQQMATAIIELLNNLEKRELIGQAASAFTRANFSSTVLVAKQLEFYRELIEDKN